MRKHPPAKGRPDPRRREPLWDRVDRNRFRLFGYLVLFFAVSTVWIAFCVWATFAILSVPIPALEDTLFVEPRLGLLVGGILTVSYVWITLARSEHWLVRELDAVTVPKGELLESKLALKDMAIAAGMPVAPTFYYVPSTNTNAFVFEAVGRRPILGVTEGFVRKLTLEEQRAAFANLIARLVSGDILVVSAMSALLAPLEEWRDSRIGQIDDELEYLESASEHFRYGDDPRYVRTSRQVGPDKLLLFLPFGMPFVFLGEVLAAVHRRSQLTAAEKADAEGMLLLKDPPAMLSALERCVELDNVVPMAGESLGELFYCWTGDSTNDEDDPEWLRVARLREVLGVEGHVPDDEPYVLPEEEIAPPPPILD